LPDPASIPHPTKGTIEFEHGQNVAKLDKVSPIVNGPFHPMPFWPSAALRLDHIGGTHDWPHNMIGRTHDWPHMAAPSAASLWGKQAVTGKIA
jgi:hypothetical protein